MKKQSRSSLLTLVLLPLFGILCVCFSMDRVPAAVLSLLTVAAAALSLRTRTYTLSNGKQITQPASRALLIAVVLFPNIAEMIRKRRQVIKQRVETSAAHQ